MDFKTFYHRHQLPLFMADHGTSARTRAVHRELRGRRLAVAA